MSAPKRLNAEIVTTGTEILLGEIVDTNAAWIAQQLRDVGVNLYYKTTVGDNAARVQEVLELALTRSDVIIVTGGLGPTVDDITRDAIAAAMQQPLVLDRTSLDEIRTRFAQFGAVMTANNERQAYMPASAVVIPNPVGTAPAFRVEDGRGMIIALPGVPREMKHLMTHAVLPFLRERSGDTGIIRRRVLRTVGVGESMLDSLIDDLMVASNPTVGLAAHFGQVDVRLTASGSDADEVGALLDEIEAEVRARIGEHVYSTTPDEPFADFLLAQLTAAGASLAVLDSVTQGRVVETLHKANPVATTFVAEWSPPAYEQNAPPSLALAEELATQARDARAATFGLALLAGDDDGAGESFLALAGPHGVTAQRLPYGGRDGFNQLRAGNRGLVMLWHALTGKEQ